MRIFEKMKSIEIKSLIALLVITITLSATLHRESKSSSKAATNTKSDGSGDWANGYDSPKILITPVGGSQQETGRYFFKPGQMSTSWKDGFEIENLTPSTPAQKDIMVSNTPGGKIYIPWRYIDDNDVESGKNTFSNKWINFKVTTDANTTYNVRLIMPWAAFSTYISTEQVTTIVNTITEKASSAKNAIIKSKTSLKTNVQELAVEMANKQKIAQDQQAIKNAAIQENNQIKTQLETKAKQLADIKIQINTKTNELSKLIDQRDTLNSETNKLANEIEGDTQLLNAEHRQKAIAEAAGKIEGLKKSITHEINAIKIQASDAYCVAAANAAQTAAFALDAGALVSNFKKIYSWNEAKP
jgi:hypothetical protein